LVAPVIFVVCIVGAYALNNKIGDVFVCIIFGLLGYEMRKFRYPRIALILGLLLGNMAEINLRQTLMMGSAWKFVTRPISLSMFILILLLLFVPVINHFKNKKRSSR